MLWNFGKPILQYCSIFKEKTKKKNSTKDLHQVLLSYQEFWQG
jgi:hypothetical protein